MHQRMTVVMRTKTNPSWRDLVVIMGELNAQVGRDNTDNERVMEKHGVGNRNLSIMVRDWWSSVVRDWWRSVL